MDGASIKEYVESAQSDIGDSPQMQEATTKASLLNDPNHGSFLALIRTTSIIYPNTNHNLLRGACQSVQHRLHRRELASEFSRRRRFD
jgi:hypothetical protein